MTPELLRSCAVVAASVPEVTSQVCSPQSRLIMDTELAHSDASRSTMEPVNPLVSSPMQYGKHPASVKVSTHTMSMDSLLQNGRTHMAASADSVVVEDEVPDVVVYRLTGQRMDSTLIFDRAHPM